MCSPTISQFAGLEALKRGDKDIDRMRNEYNRRRKYLLTEFKRLQLPCFEAQGAFYLFPYVGDCGLTSDDFALRLLNEEHVVVVPGEAFGESGAGFIRVSYASSMEALIEAVSRLEKFLRKLR